VVNEGAAAYLPDDPSDLAALRRASAGCEGCPLHRRATQTVFGEGSVQSSLVLVGEQPGDREDRDGAPFVGPAGRLLDSALLDAGIDRRAVYLTNAVKHFKWRPQGARRLHQTPSARERAACRPWLVAELEALRPRVVVCLGATAGRALLGESFRVGASRGRVLQSPYGRVVATVHPSAVLRVADPDGREAARSSLVEDLRLAARSAGADG
jgi:DNA polymerase